MPPTLLGREPELAAIESILHDVGSGGGALILRGEPGIGKSALLEWAAELADEAGAVVLKTAGAPSETQMAFAGLHRLLRQHLAGLDDLPAPQRDALSVAFGLHVQADAAAPPDIFLIALATLDLLADAAATSPLVLLVEDAHWLDAATAEVLAFVARRIELEPVALLFTVRDEVGEPARRGAPGRAASGWARRAGRRRAARVDRARAGARDPGPRPGDGGREPARR